MKVIYRLMCSQINPPKPLSIERFVDGKFDLVLFKVIDATFDECKELVEFLNNRLKVNNE